MPRKSQADQIAELQRDLTAERKKTAEAEATITRLRDTIRQHESALERANMTVVERKGRAEIGVLLQEIDNFGGYRFLPFTFRLAIDEVRRILDLG